MAYYDTIANQWHQTTGYQGGPFKKYILNDFLLAQISSIQDKAILEVGAGNGYFMAWVVERFSAGVRRCLAEIHRVLNTDGELILSTTHPDFVQNLDRRGALKRDPQGLWTMPGSQSLRLPVVRRSREKYEKLLVDAGFEYQAFDVLADQRVFKENPGLKDARSTPLGLVFRCSRK